MFPKFTNLPIESTVKILEFLDNWIIFQKLKSRWFFSILRKFTFIFIFAFFQLTLPLLRCIIPYKTLISSSWYNLMLTTQTINNLICTHFSSPSNPSKLHQKFKISHKLSVNWIKQYIHLWNLKIKR